MEKWNRSSLVGRRNSVGETGKSAEVEKKKAGGRYQTAFLPPYLRILSPSPFLPHYCSIVVAIVAITYYCLLTLLTIVAYYCCHSLLYLLLLPLSGTKPVYGPFHLSIILSILFFDLCVLRLVLLSFYLFPRSSYSLPLHLLHLRHLLSIS
eukprot:GHVS01016749.1.p2 GENE.GHVS01016749.1~~GHVS01016749.1.p2  ORF type:complete len:151 (+),score=9.80 GHVS01016749.1:1058-1510(+)